MTILGQFFGIFVQKISKKLKIAEKAQKKLEVFAICNKINIVPNCPPGRVG